MSDIVIRVQNISKLYRIGQIVGYSTLREHLTDLMSTPFRRLRRTGGFDSQPAISGYKDYIWALRDVSFEVKRGEVVGIIGRNGSGKSTLLKILCHITWPTEGHAQIRGRVGSLLEVGTGFHPELTGRENIYLNGAIIGMKKAEVERKFDEIVAFSEIEKFLDTPVKRYSSGMYVRLAFAVAAHLQPDILIVDEVLAVGDAQFQKKCLGKMGDVAKGGRTVLFVSHNMADVENLCQSGVLLDKGRTQYVGSQTMAIAEYLKSSFPAARTLRERTDRVGNGAVRVVGIEVKDMHGETLEVVASGQDISIHLYFKTAPGFRNTKVIVGLMAKTNLDVPVFLHHNDLTGNEFGQLPESGAFVCSLKQLPLSAATYRIGYTVMTADGEYLDGISDAVDLSVAEGDFFGTGHVPPFTHGVCLVKGDWHIESSSWASRY